MAKNVEAIKNAKSHAKRRLHLYEKAATKLEETWREIRRKQDIARFIYEELQLAPWHLTAEFIEVHKNAQGTAMMKLTGLGDPSGRGEAYNFLREVDAKPNKGTGNSDGALNAQIKKITGTENDLRKLTMKQMASLLRSYGMGQKEIDILKRWDRVHCIRDLSTKAASDGMGDGLERYARGEKMKLSDQKQMYRDRIQEIWRRQRTALGTLGAGIEVPSVAVAAVPELDAQPKKDGDVKDDVDMDDSDDYSDADSLDDLLKSDFMDVKKTNQILAETGGGGVGKAANQRVREDTQEMAKDARDFAALMREKEEEKKAQEGLLKRPEKNEGNMKASQQISDVNKGRKVIRRRITRTHPDGTQTTTFKFIVRPDEVDKIIHQKKKKEDQASAKASKNKDNDSKSSPSKNKKKSPVSPDSDKRTVGHAMFEDEDDILQESVSSRHKSKIQMQIQRSTRVVTTKTKSSKSSTSGGGGSQRNTSKEREGGGGGGASSSKSGNSTKAKRPKVQLAKLKQKVSQDRQKKKRKREAEEADLYSVVPQRKGTNNRRERGAARERMPHVIMADRMESIRIEVEKRPGSGPFHRPVNRRQWPQYYEVISQPIDLQTIRDKNQRYEYRLVDSFVSDFALMKHNAIKFNGVGSIIGDEATAIYDFVKQKVDSSREEFDAMEQAVKEQLSGNNHKKKKKKSSTASSDADKDEASVISEKSRISGTTANLVLDGVATTVHLGDIPTDFVVGDDTDSDDSVKEMIQL